MYIGGIRTEGIIGHVISMLSIQERKRTPRREPMTGDERLRGMEDSM